MVTVLTATYNRARTLGALYGSLCAQTCQDFEWVIMDDGSTDDTQEIVGSFIKEGKIDIRYIRQGNGGKHTAINRGVAEAKGEMLFIVDSDDSLSPDAIGWVKTTSSHILDDPSFGGISGRLYFPDGGSIGKGLEHGDIDASAIDIRLKHGVTGDLAEVFKTSVLREFPFPVFEGERFVPEALVWNRIAQRYKLRYTSKKIYCAEYLPDGLTAKIVRIRREAPMGSMTYYSELRGYDIPFAQKVKASINFWRFAPLRLYGKARRMGMINFWSIMAWPLGVAMRLNDARR